MECFPCSLSLQFLPHQLCLIPCSFRLLPLSFLSYFLPKSFILSYRFPTHLLYFGFPKPFPCFQIVSLDLTPFLPLYIPLLSVYPFPNPFCFSEPSWLIMRAAFDFSKSSIEFRAGDVVHLVDVCLAWKRLWVLFPAPQKGGMLEYLWSPFHSSGRMFRNSRLSKAAMQA